MKRKMIDAGNCVLFAVLLFISCNNAAGPDSSKGEATPDGPPFGNPAGQSAIPLGAGEEDVSNPDHIIGTGTPESVTSEAFVRAVAAGGIIVFNGGSAPFTLVLEETAKVFNDKPNVVIDGGQLVTLSGGGLRRILYMNTCDQEQVWTTDHCDNQDGPTLTVQNISFTSGNSSTAVSGDAGSGGAILAQGGRFKAVNCRFFNNQCASTGPDVGGAALRVLNQYNDLPVYIVGCTFGGAVGNGNSGSNGGGVSSISVSWHIINSLFSHNVCTGNGGNPSSPGTPGGGSGGAIYNDGLTMTLTLEGCLIERNEAQAFGSAIFFVSNDHTGTIVIKDSVIRSNSGGSWYRDGYPGISAHDDTPITVINSTIEID